MPAWVQQACHDYEKRLPKSWKFCTREFAQARSTGGGTEQMLQKEATALLNALPDSAFVVVMDVNGKPWSTDQVAQHLGLWRSESRWLVFVIGSANGLHRSVKDRADIIWCLSSLTFPHPLARVILIEQLYRAYTLLENHPYHRA